MRVITFELIRISINMKNMYVYKILRIFVAIGFKIIVE
jgi:hypothetical protein